MYLDARGQVLRAIVDYLSTTISLPPTAIRTAYPDAALLEHIGAGVDDVSPMIVVLLGDEKPSPDQSGRVDRPFYQNPTDPTVPTSVLIEDMRLTAPLTFMVVAGGDRGQSDRAKTVQAIKSLLGQTLVLPLPDGVPETATETATYDFGLTVQLIFASTREDNRLALSKLWRTDVVYTARYGSYHTETVSLITAVRTTAVLGHGGVIAPDEGVS